MLSFVKTQLLPDRQHCFLLNSFILRLYNPDTCSQRELYIWPPCLTFFNDHCYLQNKMQTPQIRIYSPWGAYPSSFIMLSLPYAHIFACGHWLFPNFSCSLVSLHTCRITSWNILLHFVHLAGSHSSLMTQFKHLLSGHPSLTPSLQ